MNWIKANPFVSILAGITFLLCAVLYLIGSSGKSKYEIAKEDFDASYDSVSKSERLPLYPKIENKDAKMKALDEYKGAIDELSSLYDGYRPGELEAMTTQEFTGKLKAAVKEVSKALEAAGCELPPGFFLGFERYQDKFAVEGATPVLNYQLEGIKHAFLQLAESKPDTLIKVFREELGEESGNAFQPEADAVSRNFGYEITFKGSETAARKFLSSLGDTKPYYYIVRCVKFQNETQNPPRVSDAEFEKVRDVAPDPVEANPFGAGFAFPGSDTEEVAVEEPAPTEEVAAEEEAPAEIDTTRILAQVLGSEDVIMFVRFDLSMFLPSTELPKP